MVGDLPIMVGMIHGTIPAGTVLPGAGALAGVADGAVFTPVIIVPGIGTVLTTTEDIGEVITVAIGDITTIIITTLLTPTGITDGQRPQEVFPTVQLQAGELPQVV